MPLKDITPDSTVYWEWGLVQLNATIVFTWLVMVLMVGGSWLVTRKLSTGVKASRWQHLLEVVVDYTRKQIEEVANQNPDPFLPFIGTLFLFILVSNILAVVPGFIPPTASLSTTAGLAICVFVAVPFFGIAGSGPLSYFKRYVQPTFMMLPFNLISDLSRTLALAVRLFGNVMSGAKIGAILLAITPIFFPVVMHLLGLLTGVIQAYIFAMLAMVYIASGTRTHQGAKDEGDGAEQHSQQEEE